MIIVNKSLSPQRIPTIMGLLTYGQSYSQIGKIMGISRQRVHQILRENQIETENLRICHFCKNPLISRSRRYHPECYKILRKVSYKKSALLNYLKRGYDVQVMLNKPYDFLINNKRIKIRYSCYRQHPTGNRSSGGHSWQVRYEDNYDIGHFIGQNGTKYINYLIPIDFIKKRYTIYFYSVSRQRGRKLRGREFLENWDILTQE